MHRRISRAARTDNARRARGAIKMITPKIVRVTANNFCKYGRVYANPGTSQNAKSTIYIIPINGSKNNNWRV
ncbi:hypothetical protein KAR91_75305 [Candidatus Pacearchaeota archaeon]|nr:hypothetical protein [Candidatus Pacearchaeota archaeon]